MIEWYRIDTVEPPKDDETPILLAHRPHKLSSFIWIVMAIWKTYTPGYTHLASYSGWEPQLPLIKDPVKSIVHEHYYTGIIGTKMFPPTHWARLD